MDDVPPPWESRVEAVLWCGRADPDAVRARLPVPVARGARVLPVVVAGLVLYREGPVGPYAELTAAAVLLRSARIRGHVGFMAVDSPRSVAGGRANWALPKELARFEATRGRVEARGEGWSAVVASRARARAIPVLAAGAVAQAWPDGAVRTFGVALRGRARPASVEVQAGGLEGWLRSGRHPAVVVSGDQVVGPPG